MSQGQTSLETEPRYRQPDIQYRYDVLPEWDFVRYLSLKPATTGAEPLVCTLHHVHIDDIPTFEAISYAWGEPVKNKIITCDNRVIRITANLHAALLQVRLPDKPRTLWVDSICINQANPQEQGHQVSLMGHIYKKSKCTLICLGMTDHIHAPIAAGLIADVNDMIQNIVKRVDFDWAPNSFPFPDREEPLLFHNGWDAFGVLLQQPWFKRGWVVQEAALAQDALVLWAETAIEWLNIVRTYIWCTRRALKLPRFQQLWLSDLHIQGFYLRRYREAVTFRPKDAVKPLTFLSILECARWLRVTDPRDRIYAFAHLPHSSRLLPALQPNYEIPYTDVYRDFACDYLRISEGLEILHFVHNDDKILQSNFPSWIPRWDSHLHSSYTGNLNNYSSSSARILSPLSAPRLTLSLDQTTLKVRAVLIDTITFNAQGFDKESTTLCDVATLWKKISTLSIPSPYSCSSLQAFATIFRCGVYRGLLKEWKTLESAYMRLLQDGLPQEDALYRSAGRFHELRMEDVHNKSFVVSSRGYYGLAPSSVKEGDICCIIFGTMAPFVLRRTDQAGQYKLVGSVLMLSKEPDHNGYPDVLGRDKCQDWENWGLEEENIILC